MSQTSPAMQLARAVGGGSFASANFSGRIATQTVSPATSAVAAVGDDVAAGLGGVDPDMVALGLDHPGLEHVHVAQEVGDKAAGRILVHLARRAELHDPALGS